MLKQNLPSYVLSQLDYSEINHIARIMGEEKSHYIVLAAESDEIMIHKKKQLDLNVGDWLILDECKEKVVRVLSTLNSLSRIKSDEVQQIASNIEEMWVLTSADKDFNINRLERYDQLAKSAGCILKIILTKVDLITDTDVEKMIQEIKERLPDIEIVPISNFDHKKVKQLISQMRSRSTIALMGSSGVGKSTLINAIFGNFAQKTQKLGVDGKGKHTTTHRRLFLTGKGVFIIDNPGIRTVAPISYQDNQIFHCRYTDCSHVSEPGCNVLLQLESGEMNKDYYVNMMKIRRETEHYNSAQIPLDKQKRKKRWKAITKAARKYKNEF